MTDGTLNVRVIESVAEMAEEGMQMHNCVFTNLYYRKANSLIMSATIDGKRIETVEVDLKSSTWRVKPKHRIPRPHCQP